MINNTNKLSSLVLLAGFSRRMGSPKQHVKIFGVSFLQHITGKLLKIKNSLSQMIFVGQASDITSKEYVKSIGGIWIDNLTPELGPLSSIRLGVKVLEEGNSLLLWPTDHPLVKETTLDLLIKEWKKNNQLITVPSDGARRGHPTIFPSWACGKFFDIRLEKGAKQILLENPDKINHVLTDDPFITTNLNTPAKLKEMENAVSLN